MKLLHVIDTMDPKKGGVSQALQTMANGIAESGVYNEVLSLDGQVGTSVNKCFTIHTLGRSQNQWGYSSKLVPWLLKNMLRFDVIIIHGLWLYSSYGVTSASSKLKKSLKKNSGSIDSPKIYVMPHGMLDPYFQSSRQRKFKAIRNLIYWKLFESKTVNRSEGVLFTCKEECRLAGKTFKPYHPKRELVVGLGVAEPPAMSALMVKSFFKRCPGLQNKPFILFLGRIDPKKGLDMLIDAYVNIYKKKIADPDDNQVQCLPKLLLAGPGWDTNYGKRIKQMVPQSYINTHIFFTGMLRGNEKWGAIHSCDVFILPSHQENFGIAVVEALACSKPVLLSNQVNINAEIKKMKAGFVEDDTLAGVAILIETWLNTSKQQKLKMGSNARLCFEQEFATGPAVSKIISAVSIPT